MLALISKTHFRRFVFAYAFPVQAGQMLELYENTRRKNPRKLGLSSIISKRKQHTLEIAANNLKLDETRVHVRIRYRRDSCTRSYKI